jgi:hypothetical protein
MLIKTQALPVSETHDDAKGFLVALEFCIKGKKRRDE